MSDANSAALGGRRIVVTRAESSGGKFATILRAMGAEVLAFPTIAVAPPDSYAVLDNAISRLGSFDWLIFTSATGVDAFAARMKSQGRRTSELERAQIAAIGPATADRLGRYKLRAKLVPSEYRAEAIAGALGDEDIRGRRFLIPRAQIAREALPELLAQKGAREVLVAPAYRTLAPLDYDASAIRALLEKGGIDLVTFTSSSTVENFHAMIGGVAWRLRAAVIGPITAETARRHGYDVVVSPADYTIDALADAIAQYFRDG